MPRGGRRAGAPGKAYANRGDLNSNRTLPVTTASGQPYGVAGAQAAAQRAVPLATQPAPTGPPPQPPAAAPMVPQGPVGAPSPAPIIPLGAPTMRPDEHVATPATMPAAQSATVGDLLSRIVPDTPELQELFQYLTSGGQ